MIPLAGGRRSFYARDMAGSANPLLPAGYDIAWTTAFLLILALTILALVSIARAAKRLTSTQAMMWTLLVVLVPVIGSLAWLAIGRVTSLSAAQADAER